MFGNNNFINYRQTIGVLNKSPDPFKTVQVHLKLADAHSGGNKVNGLSKSLQL